MKTKKFRVAKSGQTTDGRSIPAEHIQQMAANYDPAKYGARVNIEHLKSLHPDSVFKMYGDVVALTTETESDEIYLVAEVAPTDDLISLANAKQKVYFSIEYHPNFADTGEAYFMGLACTDTPASLGTSYMQFCQQHPTDNPLIGKKSNPENIISTAEFSASFDATPTAKTPDPSKHSLLTTVTQLFSHKPDPKETEAEKMATFIQQLPEHFSKLEKAIAHIAKSQDQLIDNFTETKKQQADELKNIHDNVQETLSNTVENGYTKRPPATGGSDYLKTDC